MAVVKWPGRGIFCLDARRPNRAKESNSVYGIGKHPRVGGWVFSICNIP